MRMHNLQLHYPCMQSITSLSLLFNNTHVGTCSCTYTQHTLIQKHSFPGFWLLTALMQPEAEATVLTQPLCLSLLASYRGSTKLYLQHTHSTSLSLLFFLCSCPHLFPPVWGKKCKCVHIYKTSSNYQKSVNQFYFWTMCEISLITLQFDFTVLYIMNWHCTQARAAAIGSCDSLVLLFLLWSSGPFRCVFLKPLQRKSEGPLKQVVLVSELHRPHWQVKGIIQIWANRRRQNLLFSKSHNGNTVICSQNNFNLGVPFADLIWFLSFFF